MKKKLLSILLITSMVMTIFTGCGNNPESVENTEVIDSAEEADAEEADAEESDTEVITDYFYTMQIRGLDNAVLRITSTDDSGETVVEEVGSHGWFGGPGRTLAQDMEEWNIESIEPVCDEFDFLGWSAYTIKYPEDESGSEEEVLLFDGKIFTTEEIMTLELPEYDVYFYTEWDLTCGGCEEKKLCEVHYIDDDRYFVCDDCYEEFATGMGLN